MSSSKPCKPDQVGIRMVKEPPLYSAEPVNSPQAAVRLMSETLKGEVLAVVNLRNDLKPINMNIVSIGTLNQSLAHPREILKSIILSNAGSVMLFHNHPSGNLTPSPEDVSLKDRMARICELLGTPIVDHIIIGNDDRYYSFRENNILKVPALEYARDVSDLHLGAESVSESAIERFTEMIEPYVNITELTEELLNTLIEKIVVHEKEVINGQVAMRVDIYYRFVGNIGDDSGGSLFAPGMRRDNKLLEQAEKENTCIAGAQ